MSDRIAVLVRPGEMIPRGYAVAYWRAWDDRSACYPFGLHWLVRYSSRLWRWVRYGTPKLSRSDLEEANSQLRYQVNALTQALAHKTEDAEAWKVEAIRLFALANESDQERTS